MLSRPPGDLSHFLMRDFNLQKKALDFLNFRHHLDMEEEWNENSAAQVGRVSSSIPRVDKKRTSSYFGHIERPFYYQSNLRDLG
jgi:hypothetical protein